MSLSFFINTVLPARSFSIPYFVLYPALSLVGFVLKKPKASLWSLPICLLIDLVVYGDVALYYENRETFLLLTALQLLIVLAAALIVRAKKKT